MAHTCPSKNPKHTPDLKCPCGCTDCEAGARSDLYDAIAAEGERTRQRIGDLEAEFRKFVDQGIQKK
jgi:hypothetical protein